MRKKIRKKKMEIKDKILDKVFELADKIASFPSAKRIRYELIFIGYLCVASLILSIVMFTIGDWIQGIIFSVVFASSSFLFINRSVMYKKVRFLDNFKSGLAIDKLNKVKKKEVKNGIQK